MILYDTCESELLMQHGCMRIFEPPGRVKMQNTGRVIGETTMGSI